MKRILLVEDDLSFRAIIRYQLQEMSFEVDEAGDGAAALEFCRSSEYCLVVTDIQMPVMGGMEILLLVKEIRPNLPVLVISAFSSTQQIAVALRRGAAGFLEKPCDLDSFRQTVRSLAA